MIPTRSSLSTLTGVILIVVSACSGGTNAGGNGLSLSFASMPKTAPTIGGAVSTGFITQTVGANTLVINKAQVVFSKIELATVSTATCTTDSHNSECDELRADPQVVDLPTDPTVTTALVSVVPPGTYSSFEARVKAVASTDQGGAAFLAANPSFTGVSVHVEGTYNGTSFVYDGKARADLELAFPTPIVVDSTGLNITVNVDLSTWFVDGSGALIDPATAGSGGANETLVARNIHESFEAFEDDNKDGRPDTHH